MYLVYAIFIAEVFINTSAILVPLTTYSKDFSKSDDQLHVFNVCNENASVPFEKLVIPDQLIQQTFQSPQRPPCAC